MLDLDKNTDGSYNDLIFLKPLFTTKFGAEEDLLKSMVTTSPKAQ